MKSNRVHLMAPGSPINPDDLRRLGLSGVDDLRGYIARLLGEEYRVTADARCLLAIEDDNAGGRTDDARRARDLQRALADDRVTALVALRGGAWLLRVLKRIDFDVLRRRRARLTVIGSSEVTPLVNVVAATRRGLGIHDVMPMFVLNAVRSKREAIRGFEDYWSDVGRMISGQASRRLLVGRLLSGRLPRRSEARVVGGNLTLVAAMMGGAHARAARPRGRWLALEDVREKPERIDRMLAQLGAAGMFDRVEGVLLGDFHRGHEDLQDAVLELLRFHLPSSRIPVVGRCNFGHLWPAAPLPLNRRLLLRCREDEVTIESEAG
ncbi:MAG: LD-carboxypeptidase [Phycisphaerae bacterium]|nr:LD-carboxypeptidase [Phycisphaerae bacterium]